MFHGTPGILIMFWKAVFCAVRLESHAQEQPLLCVRYIGALGLLCGTQAVLIVRLFPKAGAGSEAAFDPQTLSAVSSSAAAGLVTAT